MIVNRYMYYQDNIFKIELKKKFFQSGEYRIISLKDCKNRQNRNVYKKRKASKIIMYYK